MKETFGNLIAKELAQRNNPTDLKSSIIGKVVKVEPVIVSIDLGKILLKENEELEISEWFRYRCKLNKNAKTNKSEGMSENISTQISNLVGSCNASSCNLSAVVTAFKNAIGYIEDELLSLKCELKVNDYVTVASLEENGKYILLDKVL